MGEGARSRQVRARRAGRGEFRFRKLLRVSPQEVLFPQSRPEVGSAESAPNSDVRFDSPSVISSITSRPVQPSPSPSEIRIRDAAAAVMDSAEQELEAWQKAAQRAVSFLLSHVLAS